MSRISEVRAMCEGQIGQERNLQACKELSPVDEPLIYSVDRHLLNLRRDRSCLANMDSICNMNKYKYDALIQQINLDFNTFPFGFKTDDEVYSRFVAFCRGDDTLVKIFNEILKQSEKIYRKYEYDQYADKTVMIVTDKWDVSTFRKYEKRLLENAINKDVWCIILLATDYGYTEIPFLPHDRDAFRYERHSFIENDLDIRDMMDMIDEDAIIYTVSGGALNLNEQIVFRTDSFHFEIEKVGTGVYHDSVDNKALSVFLDKVSWLADKDNETPQPFVQAKDGAEYTLHIFGRDLKWDSAACNRGGDPRFVRIYNAIDKLYKACEKKVGN